MTWPAVTLGRIIAFLVLVAAFVLVIVGRMDLLPGIMFMALSLAMLLP